MLELLQKLCRHSHKLAVDNRDLLIRMCNERGMVFHLPSDTSLNYFAHSPEHLNKVSLLKFVGTLNISDRRQDLQLFGRLSERKVFIDKLNFFQSALRPPKPIAEVKPSDPVEYGDYYDEEYEDELTTEEILKK